MRSRLEHKKARTRRKIIFAALTLFEQHDIDETTREQIAEEADVDRGTIYNYFPSREAITKEYIQRIFRERSPEGFEISCGSRTPGRR